MQTLTQVVKACSDFLCGSAHAGDAVRHPLVFDRAAALCSGHLTRSGWSVTPDKGSEGEVSQFGALATALAATIGTGNIIGVSTAIALGGPGAVLWCWLTGVFGIATNNGESLLAVKYRTRNERELMVGGPMYTIERGLHWKWDGGAVCRPYGGGHLWHWLHGAEPRHQRCGAHHLWRAHGGERRCGYPAVGRCDPGRVKAIAQVRKAGALYEPVFTFWGAWRSWQSTGTFWRRRWRADCEKARSAQRALGGGFVGGGGWRPAVTAWPGGCFSTSRAWDRAHCGRHGPDQTRCGRPWCR